MSFQGNTISDLMLDSTQYDVNICGVIRSDEFPIVISAKNENHSFAMRIDSKGQAFARAMIQIQWSSWRVLAATLCVAASCRESKYVVR